MKSQLLSNPRYLFVLVVFLAMVSLASATCAAPSTPAAVLCFPTANATVNTPFNIEGAATGNGLPIRAMIVYVDNQKLYSFTNTDTFVQASFVGFTDGVHHAVLNAWDSGGHLFQASANFKYITGFNGNYNHTCSKPTTGIHLCLPLSNTIYPELVVPWVAQGGSEIKSIAVYLNGKRVESDAKANSIAGGANVPAGTSPTTVTVVGYDSKGKTSTATATGIHTYYDGACLRSCSPGIAISSPPAIADQSSPLRLSAEATLNPHPITNMKVYLDNTQVLNSTGPAISGSFPASKGTHLITVQAWDTTGALYKTQRTVNVQ